MMYAMMHDARVHKDVKMQEKQDLQLNFSIAIQTSKMTIRKRLRTGKRAYERKLKFETMETGQH